VHNNNRKIHSVLVGTLTVLVPCFAAASPPSDAAVGQVDAILDFCVKAAPPLSVGAHTYRVLFSGSGSSGSRSAPAYHEAYQQVSAALARGNVGQEVAACTVGLEVKDHDDSSHRDDDRKRDDDHKKDQ
jgi:hypothetical protein